MNSEQDLFFAVVEVLSIIIPIILIGGAIFFGVRLVMRWRRRAHRRKIRRARRNKHSNKNVKQPPQLSTRMVEDEARERQKKRDRDRGLVTIDGTDKKAKESVAEKDKAK